MALSLPLPLFSRPSSDIQLVATTPLVAVDMPDIYRTSRPTQYQIFTYVKAITQTIVTENCFYYLPDGSHIPKKLQLFIELLSNKDIMRCRVKLCESLLNSTMSVYKQITIPFMATISSETGALILRACEFPLDDFATTLLTNIELTSVLVKRLVVLDISNIGPLTDTETIAIDNSTDASGSSIVISSGPTPVVNGSFVLADFMLTSTAQIGVDVVCNTDPTDAPVAPCDLIQYSESCRMDLFQKVLTFQDAINSVSQCTIVSLVSAGTSTQSPSIYAKTTQLYTDDFISELADGIPGNSFNIPLMPIKILSDTDGVAMLKKFDALNAILAKNVADISLNSANLLLDMPAVLASPLIPGTPATASAPAVADTPAVNYQPAVAYAVIPTLSIDEIAQVTNQLTALQLIIGQVDVSGSTDMNGVFTEPTFTFSSSQTQAESLLIEIVDPSNGNNSTNELVPGEDDSFKSYIPIRDVGGFGHCLTVTYDDASDTFAISNYKIYHSEVSNAVQCKLNILHESVLAEFQIKLNMNIDSDQSTLSV